jgi:inhibitor of cysteine peptidase
MVCQRRTAVSEIISVSQGQEFEIVLEGIPTAGFSWVLVHPLEVAEVIQELGHEWQPSTSLVGGPAREHFRFRALAEGEVKLRFQYRRPWEDKAREERTFAVRVVSKRE